MPGVPAGDVVFIGGGVVESNATRIASGLGARMTVLDRSLQRLTALDEQSGARISTVHATPGTIEDCVFGADLVVGAVLAPGAAVGRMRSGSVMVDVAIDQGGCFATSRPTTHDQPTLDVDGIVQYRVANMPSGVARSRPLLLATRPCHSFTRWPTRAAATPWAEDRHLMNGLNLIGGAVTCKLVAAAHDMDYTPPEQAARHPALIT